MDQTCSLESFLNHVQKRDPNQTEFAQAVREVMTTLWPFLEQNPKYYRAFEMRSLSKINLGDFKGAISDMDTLIERYPDISGHYETRAYYKRKHQM